MTSPSMAIEVNNYAISELHKGNYKTAYEALNFAVTTTTSDPQTNLCGCDNDNDSSSMQTAQSEQCPYKYAWVDCTAVLQSTMAMDPKLNQGQYAPFLYMKFLLILPLDTNSPEKPEAMQTPSSCCFSWVLAYNLGVVTALLGRNIDRHGHQMLYESLRLFDQVQQRVQLELQQPSTTTCPGGPSKHWSTLQLSIWNNQACVLSELACGVMFDHERLGRLVQMGLALSKTSSVLDVGDQDRFHWTIHSLMEDKYAAAA